MGIQNWSENIILVDLPQEPEIADELEAVAEMVGDGGRFDGVFDFSGVDIMTSSSIPKLLMLQKPLVGSGRRLVLCGIAAATKGLFTLTGLDKIFHIADDKFMALATLEMLG